MTTRRNTLLTIFLVVLVLASLVGITIANYRFAQTNPGGNDFLARWNGAHYWVVKGVSPYDPSVSLAAQVMIYGRPAQPANGEDKAHFVYPLTSMIFFAPFGPLDYVTARALWMTLLEVCIVALALVSIRIADWKVSPLKLAALLLFSLLWYHSIRTIVVGQFAGIDALLLALALLFIQRKQDILAGILLALSTAKPQMVFLFIPFVFLWAFSVRRRDLIYSTLISLGLLLAVSLLMMPSWPLQWLRQLIDYPSYTGRIGSPLSVIADTMPGIRSSVSIFLHVLAGGYLAVEWILAWGKDENWFTWTALLTLVISNLISYRTATTNYLMMLPALFMIFKIWEQRWDVLGRWAVWAALLVLGVGLWALFLVTVQGNLEQPIMYLPFPFFCLVGLWWVRWWVIRPPRVLLDDLAARVG